MSGLFSYISSTIYIVSFLVFGLPLMKPFSIAFLVSSYPQFLPASIQALKHCRLFYMLAGAISFSRAAIETSPRSGLFGSSAIMASRSSSPDSLILGAFDFNFWDIE